jgi:hypothetical protein
VLKPHRVLARKWKHWRLSRVSAARCYRSASSQCTRNSPIRSPKQSSRSWRSKLNEACASCKNRRQSRLWVQKRTSHLGPVTRDIRFTPANRTLISARRCPPRLWALNQRFGPAFGAVARRGASFSNGLTQQACTRPFRLSAALGSILLPFRTKQRNVV